MCEEVSHHPDGGRSVKRGTGAGRAGRAAAMAPHPCGTMVNATAKPASTSFCEAGWGGGGAKELGVGQGAGLARCVPGIACCSSMPRPQACRVRPPAPPLDSRAGTPSDGMCAASSRRAARRPHSPASQRLRAAACSCAAVPDGAARWGSHTGGGGVRRAAVWLCPDGARAVPPHRDELLQQCVFCLPSCAPPPLARHACAAQHHSNPPPGHALFQHVRDLCVLLID